MHCLPAFVPAHVPERASPHFLRTTGPPPKILPITFSPAGGLSKPARHHHESNAERTTTPGRVSSAALSGKVALRHNGAALGLTALIPRLSCLRLRLRAHGGLGTYLSFASSPQRKVPRMHIAHDDTRMPAPGERRKPAANPPQISPRHRLPPVPRRPPETPAVRPATRHRNPIEMAASPGTLLILPYQLWQVNSCHRRRSCLLQSPITVTLPAPRRSVAMQFEHPSQTSLFARDFPHATVNPPSEMLGDFDPARRRISEGVFQQVFFLFAHVILLLRLLCTCRDATAPARGRVPVGGAKRPRFPHP